MSKLTENLERIKSATDDLRNIVGISSNNTIEQVVDAVERLKPVKENEINFYDYDGELLYSYTKDEFLELEEMPANPSHAGLTAQGWNWTLSDAKNYLAQYGWMDIGQHYVTDDDSLRIYIDLVGYRLSPTLSMQITSGSIDWGDGTQEEISSGSGVRSFTHTYSQKGYYKIKVTSPSSIILGNNSSYRLIGGSGNNRSYINSVRKIELGSRTVVRSYAFYDCTSLENINIPNGLTLIYDNAFYNCASLKCLVLPSLRYLGQAALSNLNSLKVVCLTNSTFDVGHGSANFNSLSTIKKLNVPFGMAYDDLKSCPVLEKINAITCSGMQSTSTLNSLREINSATNYINMQSWNGLSSLECIKFNQNIRSIASQCFNYNYSLLFIDFTANTQVPSISYGCFTQLPSDCIIKVPEDLYEDWCTPEYWKNVANKIRPYNNGEKIPSSKVSLVVDGGLSDTTINVPITVYKLNKNGYTLPVYSDITSTTAEADLEWSDGTNTYNFGDSITLTGNITLTIKLKS